MTRFLIPCAVRRDAVRGFAVIPEPPRGNAGRCLLRSRIAASGFREDDNGAASFHAVSRARDDAGGKRKGIQQDLG